MDYFEVTPDSDVVQIAANKDENLRPGQVVDLFEDLFAIVIGPSDNTALGLRWYSVLPLKSPSPN